MRPLLDESWDVFDQLFTVNVKESFFLMQAVAKQMVEQNEDGKIINLSFQAPPFGTNGLPENFMGAALFLVSSDSNYITNQTLNIDDENYMN